MKLLDGNGRKAAVPLLLLSGAGWIMFIVAFGWLNANSYENGSQFGDPLGDDPRRVHERWFPFWGFAVGAPVFYLLAFPHLIFGQCHIGIFSNFCVTFFLVTGGGVLYVDGEQIRTITEALSPFGISLTDFEDGRFIIAEFTGCLIAVLFVALYMLTWPFYTDVNSYERVGYSEPNRNQAQTTPAVAQFPTAYVPQSAQPGIAMQPVSVAMQQQAYSPGVVYPMSAAVPPQGVVHRPMSDAAPIPAPKQE